MKKVINLHDILVRSIWIIFIIANVAMAQSEGDLRYDHPVYKYKIQERMLCTKALELLHPSVTVEEHKATAAIYRKGSGLKGNDPRWAVIEEHYNTMIRDSSEVALGLANLCVTKIDAGYQLLEANKKYLESFECLVAGQTLTDSPHNQARLEFDLWKFLEQAGSGKIVRNQLIDGQIKNASGIKDFGPKRDEYINCARSVNYNGIEMVAYEKQKQIKRPTQLGWQQFIYSLETRADFICAILVSTDEPVTHFVASNFIQKMADKYRGKRLAGIVMWEEGTVELSDDFLTELTIWLKDEFKKLPNSTIERMTKHCQNSS